MNVLVNRQNFDRLAGLVLKERPRSKKITIKWGVDFPKFKDAIFFLQEAADRLISNDVPFEIYNVPLCLMVGYKKYIRFDESKFKKTDRCLKCSYAGECKGVFLKYYTLYDANEIGPVGMNTYLTDLEKCMVKVLQAENDISSERVLALAKRFRICAGCSDGNHVLMTGERLIKKGIVKRALKKGTYYWTLLK